MSRVDYYLAAYVYALGTGDLDALAYELVKEGHLLQALAAELGQGSRVYHIVFRNQAEKELQGHVRHAVFNKVGV